MPRRVESNARAATRTAPERMSLDEVAPFDHAPWVVLIGEGSDAENTLDFLREVWPDVEGDTAFTRTRQRRKLSPRSAHVEPVARCDVAEGDP